MRNVVLYIQFNDFEPWVLIKRGAFATLESHSKWKLCALNRILQLEILLLIVAEILKSDDMLIAFN